MATCRNQSVSRRLVSIGLMGTTISLVLEGLGSSSMNEAQTSYIEQLIACVSNLCASCEEAVEELSQRQFCPNLLQILSSPTLHVSIKRAAAQCLHTATENQVAISQSITGLSGGVDVLISVGQQVNSAEDNVDSKLCSLYCLGTLTNICGSLPSGDTADLTQKMQQILPLLLSALNPSDNILNICISPTIDDELSESQQQQAINMATGDSLSSSVLIDDEMDPSSVNETTSVEMAEGEGEKEGQKDDAGEEVYVGGDVDKPWAQNFEVMEIAAEILANVAVILKEQCVGEDEDQGGDYGEGDGEWGEEEDEDERRMENIAAQKGAQQQNFSSSVRRIELGVFDVRSAVGSCITVLTKLHTCVEVLVHRSDKENKDFASSSTDILSCTDKILTALSNFLYLVSGWTELEVHTLMDLLLKQFNSFATIFRGVTPSNASSDTDADDTGHTNIWALSSLLDHSSLQTTVRNTLSANVCCLATLHRMPMDESLLAMSNELNPLNKTLRGMRLVTLIRGISSVPFWEVTQHCLDMVSFLGSIELQFNEVKVISNTLLRRLSDPSALRTVHKQGVKGTTGSGSALRDASILVMEACVSSFIDLHSSDDPDIYAVRVAVIHTPHIICCKCIHCSCHT